ncbi:MAG: glutathione S-transferase family protein [Pseudomonadota bacterium]
MKLELVGFKICPFVQRVNILLQYKQADCVVTYLNPKDLPDWLSTLSPFGKVPLLKVDNAAVFESQVINEFIDETQGAPLMPSEPLARARQRGFVAVADGLLGSLWNWVSAKDDASADEARKALCHALSVLDGALDPVGPYFSGADFGLVDCAMAPVFMRLNALEGAGAAPLPCAELAHLARYRKAVVAVPAVQTSVVPEFVQLYLGFVKSQGGVLGAQLG